MLLQRVIKTDIQASIVAKREDRIETFQQLIERKDVKILVNIETYTLKILKRVSLTMD
jgi:hypothetical protein